MARPEDEFRNLWESMSHQEQGEALRRFAWADGLLNPGTPTDGELVFGLGSKEEIRHYLDSLKQMRETLDSHADRLGAERDAINFSEAIDRKGATLDEYVRGLGNKSEIGQYFKNWQEVEDRLRSASEDAFFERLKEARTRRSDDVHAESDTGDDRTSEGDTPRRKQQFDSRHRGLTPMQEKALQQVERFIGKNWAPKDIAMQSRFDRDQTTLSAQRVREHLRNYAPEAWDVSGVFAPQGRETGAEIRANRIVKGEMAAVLNTSFYTMKNGGLWLPGFQKTIAPVIGIRQDPLLYDVITRQKIGGPTAVEFSAEEVLATAIAESYAIAQKRVGHHAARLRRDMMKAGIAITSDQSLAGHSELRRSIRLEFKQHFRSLLEHFEGPQIGSQAYLAKDSSRLVFAMNGDRLRLSPDGIPHLDPITLALSDPEQRAMLEKNGTILRGSGMVAFGLEKLQRLGGDVHDFNFSFMAQGLYSRAEGEGMPTPARVYLNEYASELGVGVLREDESQLFYIPASKWAQLPQRAQNLVSMMDLEFHPGAGGTMRNGKKLFTTQGGTERSGVELRGFLVFGLGDTGFLNESALGRVGMPNGDPTARPQGAMVSYTQVKHVKLPRSLMANSVDMDDGFAKDTIIRPGQIFDADTKEINVAVLSDKNRAAVRTLLNPATKYGHGAFTIIRDVSYRSAQGTGYMLMDVAYDVYRPLTSTDRLMDVLKVPTLIAREGIFQKMGSIVQKYAQTPFEQTMLRAMGMDPATLGDGRNINLMAGEGVFKTGETALQSGAELLKSKEAYRLLAQIDKGEMRAIVGELKVATDASGAKVYRELDRLSDDQLVSSVRKMMVKAHTILSSGKLLNIADEGHVTASYVAFEAMKRRIQTSMSNKAAQGELSSIFHETPVGFVLPMAVRSNFSAPATPMGDRSTVSFMNYYNVGHGTDILLQMMNNTTQTQTKREAVSELMALTHLGGVSERAMFGGIHFDPLVYLSLGEENTTPLRRLSMVTEALRTGNLGKRTVGQLERIGQRLIERHAQNQNVVTNIRSDMDANEALHILQTQSKLGVKSTSYSVPVISRSDNGQVEVLQTRRVDFMSPEAVIKLQAFGDHVDKLATFQIEIQRQMVALSHLGRNMTKQDWTDYERLLDSIDEYEMERNRLTGTALQKSFGSVSTSGRNVILGGAPGIPEGTLVVGDEMMKTMRKSARAGIMAAAETIRQASMSENRGGMTKAQAVIAAFGDDLSSVKQDAKIHSEINELQHRKAEDLRRQEILDKLRQKKNLDPGVAQKATIKSYRASDAYESQRAGNQKMFASIKKRMVGKGLLGSDDKMTSVSQVEQLLHAEKLLRMEHDGASKYMLGVLQRAGAPFGFGAISAQKIMSVSQFNRLPQAVRGLLEFSPEYNTRSVIASLGAMTVFLGDYDGDMAALGALSQWAEGIAIERALINHKDLPIDGAEALGRVQQLRGSLVMDQKQHVIEFAKKYTGDDTISDYTTAIARVKQSADVYGKLRIGVMEMLEPHEALLRSLDPAARQMKVDTLINGYIKSAAFDSKLNDMLEKEDKVSDPIKKPLVLTPKVAKAIATAVAFSATAVIGQTFNAAYENRMLLRAKQDFLHAKGFSHGDIDSLEGIYQSMQQMVRDAIKPKDMDQLADAVAQGLTEDPRDFVLRNKQVKAAQALRILTNGTDFLGNRAVDLDVASKRLDPTSKAFQSYLDDIYEGLMEFHKHKAGSKAATELRSNVQKLGRVMADSQMELAWMRDYLRHARQSVSDADFDFKAHEMQTRSDADSLTPNRMKLLALLKETSRGLLSSDHSNRSMGRILRDISRSYDNLELLRHDAKMAEGMIWQTNKERTAFSDHLVRMVELVRGGSDPAAQIAEDPAMYRALRGLQTSLADTIGFSLDRGMVTAETVAERQAVIAKAREGKFYKMNSNVILPTLVSMSLLGETDEYSLGMAGAAAMMITSMPAVMIAGLRGITDPKEFATHLGAIGATMGGAMGVGAAATKFSTDALVRVTSAKTAGKVGGLIGAVAAAAAGWGLNEVFNAVSLGAGRGTVGFGRMAQGISDYMGAAQEQRNEQQRETGGQDEWEQLANVPTTMIVDEDGQLLPFETDQPADNGSYTLDGVADESGNAMPWYQSEELQYSSGMDWTSPLDGAA